MSAFLPLVLIPPSVCLMPTQVSVEELVHPSQSPLNSVKVVFTFRASARAITSLSPMALSVKNHTQSHNCGCDLFQSARLTVHVELSQCCVHLQCLSKHLCTILYICFFSYTINNCGLLPVNQPAACQPHNLQRERWGLSCYGL